MTESSPAANVRDLEAGITRDFSEQMSYGSYLDLPRLLAAQHPRSELHDEMLFIIQHQTSELWLKLVLHELRAARGLIAADDFAPALKCLARVKHILRMLVEQWDVLSTLTPSEYARLRPHLASSSGFQSYQYRAVEFILGNKNPALIDVHRHDTEVAGMLTSLLDEPTVYDELLRYLARHGYDVPAEVLGRDVRTAYALVPGVVDVWAKVYANPEANWAAYETAEELVDIEDRFQQWRFRHLQVVGRTIGSRMGTGGSSGIGFLRKALDLTFFPELYAVRDRIE